ncbi:unnamed protein product [Phaedon cochleariae]|uniref:MADF domain-containing protein n=1 Tax=Phaedon cochleariae TaxID=80249 RepID=A0A9P0GPG0_PHACE|nr:unnamed protein product [Phaedon cochleariae]
MNLDEATLIETVEAFSCIWDTKNKDHRNILVVENARKSIGNIMQASGTWKSLRAKYIRERKLIVTRPSGSAAYTGHWTLFKTMGFLANVVQSRRTSGNVSKNSGHKPSQVWNTNIIIEETETENFEDSQVEGLLDETLIQHSQSSQEEEEETQQRHRHVITVRVRSYSEYEEL